MTSSKRAEVAIVAISAVLAVAAIAAPLTGLGQPLRFIAVFGAVLLGPGGLAYRLATGARWSECLMVGVALNVAAVMVVALVAVAAHFWHPRVELVIPVATCVLAAVLSGRLARDTTGSGGLQRPAR